MKKILAIAGGVALAAASVALHPSAQAQSFPAPPKSCIWLREVTTGTQPIRKTITTANSNANVDFAVPAGTQFKKYMAQLIPENDARYTAEVNLIYNDNSTSRVATRTIEGRRFFLYNLPFQPPTGRQPIRVNTRVTGQRGIAYRVAVMACP